MASTNTELPKSLGFCTVRQHADHGYFGGYLILNTHARPLEFHCTMPVKPSRAQEILYGATLPDFVCGEQIAKALISKAKLAPELVFTDCPAVLAVSRVSEVLVACVGVEETSKSLNHSGPVIPKADATRTRAIEIHQATLRILCDDLHSESKIRQVWQQLEISLDIYEPFQRIAEALVEAHPVMKAA